MPNDLLCDEFQDIVAEVLIRHKSILDIITKLEESNARINRALIKSVTSCGCISINAKKQEFKHESLKEAKNTIDNHLEGKMCDSCKEKIEEELGKHLFYIAALCNTLDLNFYDLIIKEYKKLNTLGIYTLR
ncbi:hypothetical protein Y919_08060 [Caloranaerobacter azorensis H53214]|uniref:DUF1573 domain-containing protein n=1 Tax=Caloranaerobacter azorensis H53214 TaxID=1156417 RepID=A0A096BGW6_9FIRM|nr:hypothetical protein [Caloranaerobacter azorensis]KGG80112.1 hypothetical protein Y919_08060 [Caloranaerobacter azorensis H53214]